MTKQTTYAAVGVDVNVEAQAAKILYQAARKTWQNRDKTVGAVIMPHDDFSGLRYVDISGLPSGTVLFGGSDGVATKAIIAEKLQKFDTLGFDLVAMVCDDAVIRGGEPILLKSVLDVNSLGQDATRLGFIRQLAKGYVQAANAAGVAIINGELAQLSDTFGAVKDFRLSWSADVTWLAHRSRLLSGKAVRPNMALVALREPGPRSNGLTLLRKALERRYGQQWYDQPHANTTLGNMALKPSVIYTRLLLELTGGYDLQRKPKAVVCGAAHITGGGLPEKLGRLLRVSGCGAKLTNPYKPGKVLQIAQQAGKISDKEAYRTWNMGQGMIVITPEPEKVIAVARQHAISAQKVGHIVSHKKICIVSQGAESPGKELVFNI